MPRVKTAQEMCFQRKSQFS